MANQTLNLAVLLNAHNAQSRMTANRFQSRLLLAVAAVGAAAIAFFAPSSIAADRANPVQMKPAPVAAKATAKPVVVAAAPEVAQINDQAVQALARSKKLLASTATSTAKPTVRTVRMLVTAYCPCTKCCGANAQGITASGKHVSHNQGRFVAADKKVFRFGTKLIIPGYHNEMPVEVLDTGSAIKGNRLDVYYPSHQRALEWGKQWVDVTVVESK